MRDQDIQAGSRMTVSDAVEARRSIRAFLPDPVAGRLVREVLDKAARAPSGGNVQPWQVHALSGEPLRRLKALVAQAIDSGAGYEPSEYDVYPHDLWEPHRGYRFECGEDMYGVLGIDRADKAGRLSQFRNNFTFFGAPVGLFFSLDRRMGPPQWADVGMFMQTLMLLASEAGLDSCSQECWSLFAATVGRFIELPTGHMLFCGMALGYRDPTAAVNTLRTRRAALEDFAHLRGFDD